MMLAVLIDSTVEGPRYYVWHLTMCLYFVNGINLSTILYDSCCCCCSPSSAI